MIADRRNVAAAFALALASPPPRRCGDQGGRRVVSARRQLEAAGVDRGRQARLFRQGAEGDLHRQRRRHPGRQQDDLLGADDLHGEGRRAGDAAPAADAAKSAGGAFVEPRQAPRRRGPVTVISKTQVATGDRGSYDKAQNKVWLIGNVTLSDGGNVTKGDKLTYDLTTGQATVDTERRRPRQRPVHPRLGRRRAAMTSPARRSREGGLAIASDASHAQPPRPDRPDLSGASSLESRPRAAADARASAEADVAEGYLAVHNLGKSYGARAVVQDVSLYVRRGEAVGLLGPNGAGKTTVFYMITGLVRPDKGVIELDGYPVTSLPMYQRARLGIGYLPQEASIFRGLNVEDNIRAVLEVTEPDRRAREAKLNSLLEEFDIARLRKAPSIALSGGERRRCEIARALAGNPSFMLLDEPFAGIDPIAVGDIQDLVRHLKGRGIGVLITDHNVRETLGLIDRAYIIHSGQVLTEGSPDAIIAHPDVRRYYLGEDFRM